MVGRQISDAAGWQRWPASGPGHARRIGRRPVTAARRLSVFRIPFGTKSGLAGLPRVYHLPPTTGARKAARRQQPIRTKPISRAPSLHEYGWRYRLLARSHQNPELRFVLVQLALPALVPKSSCCRRMNGAMTDNRSERAAPSPNGPRWKPSYPWR
jgi:hypothetical protein